MALRNILRNKFYSSLNIAGLAFGLTASFLIGLYVYDELSFDAFHEDYKKIYHVGTHVNFGGQEYKVAASDAPLASAMVNGIPGVEAATRIVESKKVIVKYHDKTFKETNVLSADSNFFEFFSFKLTEGNAKTALKEPNSIVLTTPTAIKYFGNELAIGKIIIVDKEAFTVTGISEKPAANSHIQYDMLLSVMSNKEMRNPGWSNFEVMTYFKKNPATDVSSIDAGLKDIFRKNLAPSAEKWLGESFDAFEKKGGIYKFFAYPLSSSHLSQLDVLGTLSSSGDIKNVYIMSIVGLFILVIACINFMNLSTARAASRAKEVGLRKTLGSPRFNLIFQFLSESSLYVLAAMAIALLAGYFLLPFFNTLSGKIISFNVVTSFPVIAGITIILLAVAGLAGSYPAFYLTSFNPIDVLKGNVRAGLKSKGIRSSLVVVQFTISIALIICTMIVQSQLSYMQNKNMGLDKQSVLVIESTDRLAKNRAAFIQSVSSQSSVVKTSYVTNVFLNRISGYRAVGKTQDILLPDLHADYNFLELLKIRLLKGRYFSTSFPSDSLAIVVNEATVKELGWKDPLSEKLTFEKTDLHVIGVIKDFNFESTKSKIKPLVIRLTKASNSLIIRYSGNPKDVVASVEKLWDQIAAGEPYEFSFLDESFDKLFREEKRLSQLFTVMSSVAIFVACIGLLGLASFTAEQRTKEIGIRKVMGASAASINALLSKEFMKLVGISFIAASALAWYFMNAWLKEFAYRIALGPTLFVVGGLMAACIAWLTVSYHFIKAAHSNPTESLRFE